MLLGLLLLGLLGLALGCVRPLLLAGLGLRGRRLLSLRRGLGSLGGLRARLREAGVLRVDGLVLGFVLEGLARKVLFFFAAVLLFALALALALRVVALFLVLFLFARAVLLVIVAAIVELALLRLRVLGVVLLLKIVLLEIVDFLLLLIRLEGGLTRLLVPLARLFLHFGLVLFLETVLLVDDFLHRDDDRALVLGVRLLLSLLLTPRLTTATLRREVLTSWRGQAAARLSPPKY